MASRRPLMLLYLALATLLVVLCSCGDPRSLLPSQGGAAETATPPAPAKIAPQDSPFQAVQPDVAVRGLDAARRSIENHFEGFLQRDDIGLDRKLPRILWDDIKELGRTLSSSTPLSDGSTPLNLALDLLPFPILLIVFGLFLLLESQCRRLGHRWQAGIHIELSIGLSRLLRALVLVTAAGMPAALMILPSYFPIQALFSGAPWTAYLTHVLWILLAYRVAVASAEATLGLRLVRVDDDHVHILLRFVRRYARLIVVLVALLYALSDFGANPLYRRSARVVLELLMATAPLYAMRIREAVIDLLPNERGSKAYLAFRDALVRNYNAIALLTMLLLTMRALGYVAATTFILTRGYAIILAIIATFTLLGRMRYGFGRRIDALEARDVQRELLSNIQQLLSIAVVLGAIVVSLQIVGFWEATVALLKIPVFAVYRVEFSLFNGLSALVIIGTSVLVAKVIKFVLNAKVYPTFRIDIGVAYAINTILNYLIVVVGFFLVLIALGVNLSALTVVLASLSVGIGFGLQTIVENLISGFILLFGRSVQKGDYVTVQGVYGRIEAVGARSVVMRSIDNYDILIPSKVLVNESIINWTYKDDIVRLRLPVGVSYNCDPRHVEAILLGCAQREDYVLNEPSPEVWLRRFGESSVDFEVLAYFDCQRMTPERLKSRLYYAIWDALAEAHIEIPFPQRDLHLRSPDLLPQLKALLEASQGDDPSTS